ncbi:MAG: hypothetical protein QM689_06610 [Oscillospiraceae bacterium]
MAMLVSFVLDPTENGGYPYADGSKPSVPPDFTSLYTPAMFRVTARAGGYPIPDTARPSEAFAMRGNYGRGRIFKLNAPINDGYPYTTAELFNLRLCAVSVQGLYLGSVPVRRVYARGSGVFECWR